MPHRSGVKEADLGTKPALTLGAAKQIAAAAEAHALKKEWPLMIAIVGDGGHLIYLQGLDDTQIGSVEVAHAKARTAVRFKRPTKAMEDAVADGREVMLALPGATPVEGDLPITVDGKVPR